MFRSNWRLYFKAAGSISIDRYRIMHVLEGCFDVYFPSYEATRETDSKITLEGSHEQFLTRIHALYHFLHDTTKPSMTIKTTIFTHRPCVSFAYVAFCLWRHDRLRITSQWPDNCDASTWQVISNSPPVRLLKVNHISIYSSCKCQNQSRGHQEETNCLSHRIRCLFLYLVILDGPHLPAPQEQSLLPPTRLRSKAHYKLAIYITNIV